MLEDRQIVVELASLGEALRLLDPRPRHQHNTDIIDALQGILRAAGVSLELRVKGHAVAKFDALSRSGVALRLLCPPDDTLTDTEPEPAT